MRIQRVGSAVRTIKMLSAAFRRDQVIHNKRDRIRSFLLGKRYGPRVMSEFLSTHVRSHSCGALRAGDAGKPAVLTGWVQTYRDFGGCVFIDLRDREGLTQLVIDPTYSGEAAHKIARDLRNEWCIGVTGEVRSRGTNVNDK